MNQELANILKQVADELSSMAHEDFINLLDSHEPGEIAYFLKGQESNLLDSHDLFIDIDLPMFSDESYTNLGDMTTYNPLYGTVRSSDIASVESLEWGDECPSTLAA